MGQQADVRNIVRVHDLHRMLSISLRAGLVTKDAKGEYRDADAAHVVSNRLQNLTVARHVVRIEIDGDDTRRSCRAHPRGLVLEVTTTTPSCSEYYGASWSEARCHLQPDLAPAAENYYCAGI